MTLFFSVCLSHIVTPCQLFKSFSSPVLVTFHHGSQNIYMNSLFQEKNAKEESMADGIMFLNF